MSAIFCCLILSCFIRSSVPLSVCTFLFFFIWGLHALTPWKSPLPSETTIQRFVSPTPVSLEGIISSRPVATSNGSNFVMRTERVFREGKTVQVKGDMMVHVLTGDVTVARGDRVRLTTRISQPRRLGLPGEFDYPRYLALQGINVTGRVATADEIVLMRGGAENSLLRYIDLAARRLGDFIRTSEPNIEVSSVLTALLLGDQKRIPDQLNNFYTRA
ncbi:MAG: ComEC/Rec2 family competence protein, partial [Deltaproteobacteria bacterium]